MSYFTRMYSRVVFRWSAQIFLLCVLSTMLLMFYATKTQNEEEMKLAIERKKISLVEELRMERLRELQRTMFLHPKRPADYPYNINVSLAEKIPLERPVPDSRPRSCRQLKYDLSQYPTTTVIIIFYNEALAMLLRTVHSILTRTPPQLLEEIILVNDHSVNEDLGETLEKYIKLLPKVKLVKTRQREGLIRARMLGAGMAKGEVLMFQDAHMENNVQWLEPILEEMRKNPNIVVQPHVDAISQETIAYESSAGTVPRGGFSWDLRYTWMEMPDHEKKRIGGKENVAERTPTLVGCALAVNKKFFFSIGGFDEDMKIWGAENIELAFRTWLCGGEVLSHPCSRIAHTFKPFSYNFDGDREKIVQKNQMRLAEVWMDDWKKFFLASTWSWPTKHTKFSEEEKRTLEQRKALKRKLKCKPFKWYMENIVPEVPTPPTEAREYGEVVNLNTEACWFMADDGYVALTYFCFFHRTLPNNLFFINKDGQLYYHGQDDSKTCLRIEKSTLLLKKGPCVTSNDPTERWEHQRWAEVEGKTRVLWVNPNTGREEWGCITQVTNINKAHHKEQMPQVLPCDDNDEFQKWRWTYVFDFDYHWWDE